MQHDEHAGRNAGQEDDDAVNLTDEKRQKVKDAAALLHDENEDLNSPSIKPMTSSARDDSEAERLREILPPPNPLLPKSVKVHAMRAPDSSIKGITFRKLKEFK